LSTACESETTVLVGESINELVTPIESTQHVSNFSAPDFSVTEYSPQDTTSVFDPVGKHIPIKLKRQI
jgi:hypothetical protein